MGCCINGVLYQWSAVSMGCCIDHDVLVADRSILRMLVIG